MNSIKGFFKKLLKKSFWIELEDSVTYPSTENICEAIEKYAKESKETLTFERKEKPITFYLDNKHFQVEIKMARGGYYLLCIAL